MGPGVFVPRAGRNVDGPRGHARRDAPDSSSDARREPRRTRPGNGTVVLRTSPPPPPRPEERRGRHWRCGSGRPANAGNLQTKASEGEGGAAPPPPHATPPPRGSEEGVSLWGRGGGMCERA